jgi:hypothetical protein
MKVPTETNFMKKAAFTDTQTACIHTTKHGYLSHEMSEYKQLQKATTK